MTSGSYSAQSELTSGSAGRIAPAMSSVCTEATTKILDADPECSGSLRRVALWVSPEICGCPTCVASGFCRLNCLPSGCVRKCSGCTGRLFRKLLLIRFWANSENDRKILMIPEIVLAGNPDLKEALKCL